VVTICSLDVDAKPPAQQADLTVNSNITVGLRYYYSGFEGQGMKTRIRIALVIAGVLYAAWGFGLLFAPESSHRLMSLEGTDSATTRLFGAAMLAWAYAFVAAAQQPVRELLRIAATAMLVIGATAAYLMFGARSMLVQVTTIVSLVVDLGVCGYLFMALTTMEHKAQARALRAKRRQRTVAAKKTSVSKTSVGKEVANKTFAKKVKRKKAGKKGSR